MKSLQYDMWRPSTAQEPRAKPFGCVSVLHQPVLTDKDRADIEASLKRCVEQLAQRMGRKAAANV